MCSRSHHIHPSIHQFKLADQFGNIPKPAFKWHPKRGEIQDVLPGTVNTLRGVADRAGQVSDLGNLQTFAEDTLHDILEEEHQEEIPVTPQRRVRFQTSTPVVRPMERLRERVQPSRVPQVPSAEKSLSRYPEARDLFEEGFSRSLQAAATEFKKLREPKVAKFKGGYSSDASLIFQSWLKDIWVYTIERRLSQREAIQLVKDYTSEQARSEVEYYLGLTPKEEQSFQGLIDHLSLAFQSCEDCQLPDSRLLQLVSEDQGNRGCLCR